MTIIEALHDPRMFGALPAFRDLVSWRAWLVFLRACYGLAMDAKEQAIFCEHTGRATYEPPPGGWPEVVCIVGRQSGKTRIAATVAAFEAMRSVPEEDGTELYALLIAQDQRSSLRSIFSYAAAPFDRVAALQRMVPSGWRGLWRKARRADSLTLETGVRLAVYPCRPAAVRGVRACVAIADELAFFKSSEGYPTDVEMLRALRPCLATTRGKLVVLSSPYAQSGALYDLHRRHHGRDSGDVLVWQASAPEMNPTLPADYLRRMQADDPEAYRSEVLGEFRPGLSTFLDPAALAACVDAGVRERRPAGAEYVSFVDAASGSGKDAFTVAIAHAEGERAVLDVVRAWTPPFNPSGAIAEAALLLKRYRISETTGDRYAPGFVMEGFRSHGIGYQASERDRSALYLELLPAINAGSVLLLDDAELLRELRALERRRGSSGRDRVDHASGAHDDRANAAAGALVLAASESAEMPMMLYSSDADSDYQAWMRTHRRSHVEDTAPELDAQLRVLLQEFAAAADLDDAAAVERADAAITAHVDAVERIDAASGARLRAHLQRVEDALVQAFGVGR